MAWVENMYCQRTTCVMNIRTTKTAHTSVWAVFFVIHKGLEPERVSAYRKCAGGTCFQTVGKGAEPPISLLPFWLEDFGDMAVPLYSSNRQSLHSPAFPAVCHPAKTILQDEKRASPVLPKARGRYRNAKHLGDRADRRSRRSRLLRSSPVSRTIKTAHTSVWAVFYCYP